LGKHQPASSTGLPNAMATALERIKRYQDSLEDKRDLFKLRLALEQECSLATRCFHLAEPEQFLWRSSQSVWAGVVDWADLTEAVWPPSIKLLLLSFTLHLSALYLGSAPHLCSEPECYGNLIQMKTVLLLPPQALSKRRCTVQDAAEPGFLAEPSGGAQREARISAADSGMKPAIEEIDRLEAGQARSLEDLGHIPFLSSGLVLKLMTHDTSRWKPAPLRLRLAAALCGNTSWTVQHLFACTWRQQSAKGPKKRSELLESSLSWRALSHGIGRLLLLSFTLRLSALYLGSAPHLCSEPECYGNLIQMKTVLLLPPQALSKRRCTVQDAAELGFLAEPSGGAQREARISAADSGMKPAIEEIDRLEAGQARSLEDLGHIPFLSSGLVLKLMTHDTSRWKPAPLRLRLAAALCGSTVSRILDSAAPLRLHLAEAECKGTEEEVRAVGKQLKLASLVARDWEAAMAASLTSSRFVVLVEVVGAVALDTSSKACADLQYAAADSALYTQHSCQASVAEFHPVLLLPPQALSKRRCTVQDAAEPGFLAEPSGGAQREARISAADSGMKPAIEEIDRLEAGQARSLEDLGHIPFLSSGLVLKLMTHDTSRWKPTPLRLRLAAAQCEEEQKKGAAKAEVQAARQRSELPERSLSWRMKPAIEEIDRLEAGQARSLEDLGHIPFLSSGLVLKLMTHDTSRWKPAPLRLRLVAALCGSTVSRILDSAAPLRLHLAAAECKGTEEEVRAVGKQLKLASLVARDWEAAMAASLTSSRFVVLVEVVGAVALDTSSKACADLQYAAADSALYTQHSCQASVAEFHPVLLLPPQALSKRRCTVQDAAEPGFLAEPSGGAQREARISAADSGMKPAIEEIDRLEAAAPLRLRLAAAQCEEEQKKGAAKAEVQAARQRSELPERSLSWRALSHGIGRLLLLSFTLRLSALYPGSAPYLCSEPECYGNLIQMKPCPVSRILDSAAPLRLRLHVAEEEVLAAGKALRRASLVTRDAEGDDAQSIPEAGDFVVPLLPFTLPRYESDRSLVGWRWTANNADSEAEAKDIVSQAATPLPALAADELRPPEGCQGWSENWNPGGNGSAPAIPAAASSLALPRMEPAIKEMDRLEAKALEKESFTGFRCCVSPCASAPCTSAAPRTFVRRCRNAAEPGFLAEPSGGAQQEAWISAADSGMKPAIEEIDRLEAGANNADSQADAKDGTSDQRDGSPGSQGIRKRIVYRLPLLCFTLRLRALYLGSAPRCRNAAEPGFLAEPSGGAQREARISAADSGMKPAIEEIDRLEAGVPLLPFTLPRYESDRSLANNADSEAEAK
ncbi:unnamed protein product, partial [Cladocopium goreaui]